MQPTSVTTDNVARYEQPRMQLFAGERRLFHRYLAREMRVLDLGSGSGRVTSHLVNAGARVVACDLNPLTLGELRRNVGPSPSLSILRADARQLPLQDASFDMVVFAFNGLDFLHPESERRRAVAEIDRVLRPGGYFIFSSHNRLGMLLTPRGLRSWDAWRWRLRFVLLKNPGDRYFRDTNGLLLYEACPREIIEQVSGGGRFRLLRVQNRSGHLTTIPLVSLFSAWPSYVFLKEGPGGRPDGAPAVV